MEQMTEEVDTFDGVIELAVMSTKGDERLIWNANDPVQVRQAREKFNSYIKMGYFAYAVDERTGNKKNRKVLRFDGMAEEVVLVKFDDVVRHSKKGHKITMTPAVVGG